MANFFPRWTNQLPLKIVVCGAIFGGLVVLFYWYYMTADYARVGYAPVQPVAFDHSLHAGQLGMDCRYCHSFVEVSSHSNVPATHTCMKCHSQVQKESPKLELVRRSYETGEPVPWVRIHQAPDYVYFNHAVHVSRGVSCVSCHGNIHEMEVVYHAKSQTMGWCLECHRAPEKHIRPLEHVYDLAWKPDPDAGQTQIALGKELKERWAVNPPQTCAACHR